MNRVDTVRKYSRDVLQRARVPMPPYGYEVRWNEQPRRHKVFPDALTFVLPVGQVECSPFDKALNGEHSWSSDEYLDVERLGRALHDTYGLLARRLRVSGNDDAVNKTRSSIATYSRGTANGGGLYPLEFYWISGASMRQTPGIYHWNTNSGRLQRLLSGDVTMAVRKALAKDSETDQFLLVTVKYWKNSFKYNSFTHHVVTSDLGSAVEVLRWEGLVDAKNRAPHFWFDSAALDGLLGFNPLEETTLAVLPLPAGSGDMSPAQPVSTAQVRIVESEKFTRRVVFDQIIDVIDAERSDHTLPTLGDLNVTVPLAHAVGEPVPMPLPMHHGTSLGLSEALFCRRSAFGTFDGSRSMTLEDLSYLLHAMYVSSCPATEVGKEQLGWPAVLINRVDGVDPGAYLVDVGNWCLVPVDSRSPGEFLQETYFLDNYNVDHAEAVLVLLVPVDRIIDEVGVRGVRLANAVLGAATQATYVAAADLDLACGAALGFDSVSYAERLGVEASGLKPLIMIMVGHDRVDQADLLSPLSSTLG